MVQSWGWREGGVPVFLLIAAGVFGLDLLSKQLVIAALRPGESVALIENVFHLTRVHNPGVSFGLGASLGGLHIATAVLALGLFSYLGRRLRGRGMPLAIAVGLLLGGVAGNLLDRLRWGYVVDFLDFRIWPVFNVADAALTVGSVALVFLIWREGRL